MNCAFNTGRRKQGERGACSTLPEEKSSEICLSVGGAVRGEAACDLGKAWNTSSLLSTLMALVKVGLRDKDQLLGWGVGRVVILIAGF